LQKERHLISCVICGKPVMAINRQKYCSLRCGWRSKNKSIIPHELSKINHKVVSVGFYGYGDTYNLEVDNYHNFPANGVMVHNCQDALRYGLLVLFNTKTYEVIRPARVVFRKRLTADASTGY